MKDYTRAAGAAEAYKDTGYILGKDLDTIIDCFLELAEPRKVIADLAAENEKMSRQVAELSKLVGELADEVEAYVHNEYPPALLKYPHNEIKFVRDMQTVVKARAALGKVAE